MNAICLVFDRLHAGCLGAYGNTWITTPGFDRLAANSFLFDQAMIDSPELPRLYRTAWQGRHAMCPASKTSLADVPTLAALLKQQGVKTALATDDPTVANDPLSIDFDELLVLPSPPSPQLAADIEQTHFAQCFMRIMDWLDAAQGPFFLWCHLAGLGTIWDAPLSFRQAYCEEGDPPAIESAAVPGFVLPPDYDPDQLLGVTQAYAGQITLLDQCLDAFFDFLQERPYFSDTLLTLFGARGFPLGEHGVVGDVSVIPPDKLRLYSELLQTPWLLRLPSSLDGESAAARTQALVEPADLWATLLEVFQISDRPAAPSGRSVLPLVRQEISRLHDRLCSIDAAGRRAIRTGAWHLCEGSQKSSNLSQSAELYAKPDDRWEANDVLSRCNDVAEELAAAVNDFARAMASDGAAAIPPLAKSLEAE